MNKLNIPGKVRIGSMDYTVELTKNVILVDHKECCGDVDLLKKVIRINVDNQNKQEMEATLLHEIFHGIVFERNFAYEKNNDETITEELARGFHQIIKDNPDIFKS